MMSATSWLRRLRHHCTLRDIWTRGIVIAAWTVETPNGYQFEHEIRRCRICKKPYAIEHLDGPTVAISEAEAARIVEGDHSLTSDEMVARISNRYFGRTA